MPELRKRKAPEPAAPPLFKRTSSVMSGASKNSSSNGTSSATKAAIGDSINLHGFGGEIETHDGNKVTLKSLVEESENGVVLFTYPKASTPGCTTQACLFRDDYDTLTATGLAIYGLSTDSPKSNTAFKAKQSLPYTLLCDPRATLVEAIGLKKSPRGTTRGVFVVDKAGKVQAATPGGPAATVAVVREIVSKHKDTNALDGGIATKAGAGAGASAEATTESDGKMEDQAKAEVAAQVADTAQELDH